MKQVTPNFADAVVSRFISHLSRLRRFVRYWGTMYVDGVEVFKDRKYYYPNMDESTEKLAKYLKVLKDVKQKQSGISSAWFYLNPNKLKETAGEWTTTVLVNNFNKALTRDLRCTVTIGPSYKKRKLAPAGILTPVDNQAELIQEIKNKYTTLWEQGHSFFSGEADPYLAILSLYILRSSDIPYTVDSVEETVSSTFVPSTNLSPHVLDSVKAWRVTFSIPNYAFTADTDIIDLLQEDVKKDRLADIQVKEYLEAGATPPDPDEGEDPDDPIYEDAVNTNQSPFWYKASNGKRYLRADIIDSPSLNTREKLEYIMSCLDTNFRKKKAKWYEVVIAVIIVVVLTYFAGPAGAKAGSAIGGGALGTVVSVATIMTVAALYISLAALALSYLGAQNIAGTMGQFLKNVSPLVRIASIISIFASIYTAFRRSAEKAAQDAVAREATNQATTEALKSGVVSRISQAASEVILGFSKLSDVTMNHVMKMVSFIFDIYKDMEQRDLQRDIRNYRNEIAEMAEAKEQSETSDIMKELASTYPNLLSNDWSFYSGIYDRPYEWWATPYHLGNIQATTVNALWLNDPENAILYNNYTGGS